MSIEGFIQRGDALGFPPRIWKSYDVIIARLNSRSEVIVNIQNEVGFAHGSQVSEAHFNI